MNRICLLVWIAVFLVGCSPTIHYIGRTYQSTNEVDLFFDPANIKQEYEIMGQVEGTEGLLSLSSSSFSDIQEEIVKLAKQKGADGILIYGMERRTLSHNTDFATRVGTSGSDWAGKQTTVSTSTSTRALTEDMLRADFIKYK